MASRYNQLTMLYIFNILKLDASPKKPYSAPMVHRRLKELGINLDRKTVLSYDDPYRTDAVCRTRMKSLFSDSICAVNCFDAGKRKGKKAGKMAESPEMKAVTGSVCRKRKSRENCVLYYYIEDEMSPEELELLSKYRCY